MEWNQISEKWVAMTQRLRHDCYPVPQAISPLQALGRQTKTADGAQGNSMLPRMSGQISGRDSSLSSNE